MCLVIFYIVLYTHVLYKYATNSKDMKVKDSNSSFLIKVSHIKQLFQQENKTKFNMQNSLKYNFPFHYMA